uniref:Extended synaptotagmin-2 n=1 Tax=Clastoptera arizonana TaxID=38151 RepID=A0A1B6EBI7_9HEMI
MAVESKEGSSAVEVKKVVGGSNIFQILKTTAKYVSTVGVVYLLGYFNISAAWLIAPIILVVTREELKKGKDLKRNIAKSSALRSEKEVILARVDELPAWVYFPDVDRAEWLNKILQQVWPNVNHYAKDLIKDVIEPNIQIALAEYKMKGFRFEKMRLGTIPPRIGGVKVYDRNVDRTEIIMDVDLFYAGNCDVSFLISGISCGIKDFQIHGMMRVIMKPLITTMPLVGGLQIFFLNNPTIDFNLVGAADFLDMPGLSDMLRRVIVEQVAALMVLPNKLPIKLSDAVPAQTLKFPEPEGVLRVHVVGAKDLMKKDISMLGKGKSDPYAIISVGAQTFKTHTIDNTVNPKWDFWCEFTIDALVGQTVTIMLMDEDHSKKDSNLGRATVEVHGVTKKGEVDTWVSLEEAKTGMVHLRMKWLQFSSQLSDLKNAINETQQLRVTSMSTAVLMVFVDSAKNLPWSRATPDAYINLSVAKTSHNSNVVYRTDSPVFEQGFTFLVNNPETDTLHIKIFDQKTTTELGYLSYNLSQLLEADKLELDDQPLRLIKSGPDSKIILSMRLRILKYYPVSVVDAPAKENDLLHEPEVEAVPLLTKPQNETADSNTPKLLSSAPSVEEPVSTPVEDLMLSSSAPPKVESVPPGLHHRTLSTTSSSGEFGLGRIQLTLRYSMQRQRLVVLVHRIANLPLLDHNDIPDPYVKLYLRPERSKDSKRKTETVKDNCNPIYDESFEYIISQAELNGHQLEVTVLTQKTWKSPVIGQVIVDLGPLDLSKAITAWYDLEHASAIHNSG